MKQLIVTGKINNNNLVDVGLRGAVSPVPVLHTFHSRITTIHGDTIIKRQTTTLYELQHFRYTFVRHDDGNE
jgi:hypothetical protein